jgi:hypothetical protein
MTLGNTETVTGVKTFGSAGAVGRLKVAGTTSGTTVLDASATASGTLTLPAATDTLIGKATTDTLTNKTFDTAGTGNSFSIAGVAATANTGTGAVARAAAPIFTTPILGAASATTLNGNTFTTGTYTLTGSAAKTLTFSNSLTIAGTDSTTLTFQGTDTYVGRTTTDTLTNKTLTSPTINTPTVSAPAITGLANFQGARKDSTQSAPSQITSNQNDYNPSSVVCASSTTLLINSDAARDVTGIAGGTAGCDLFLFNNGSFTITLKDGSASSTAANRFDFGADFALASKSAAHLKYDGTASRWRNTTGSGAGGGGSGTVTSVATAGLATGGTITTSGTITVTAATKSDQQTGTSTTTVVAPAQQQSHDSAIKAFARCTNSAGTYTLGDSYNISGGTCGKTGTGTLTITFATGFAATTYACVVTSEAGVLSATGTQTQTTVAIILRLASAPGTSVDGNFGVQCTGRQ